jgi:ribosomal protein S30
MHQTSSHWSILIDFDRKSRVLLAYSPARRNVKKYQMRVASFARFGSLARSRGAPGAGG